MTGQAEAMRRQAIPLKGQAEPLTGQVEAMRRHAILLREQVKQLKDRQYH